MLIASPASGRCGSRGREPAEEGEKLFFARVLSDSHTHTAACGFSINLWVVLQLSKYPLGFGISVNSQGFFFFFSFMSAVEEFFSVKLSLSFKCCSDSRCKFIWPQSSRRRTGKLRHLLCGRGDLRYYCIVLVLILQHDFRNIVFPLKHQDFLSQSSKWKHLQ